MRNAYAWMCVAAAALGVGCNGQAPPGEPAQAVPDVVEAEIAEPVVERDDQGFEVDPPGAWLAGDLHVHATGASNDTGGDSTPQAIAARAREMGLFFVVLTDHSNSTGSDPTTTDEDPGLFNQGPEFTWWDEALALSEPGVFLMRAGNEVSPVADGDPPTEPRGHIGCIPPADEATLDRDTPLIDRPRGEVTGGEALAQARELGCFTVVNHPYAPAAWIQYDWTDLGYHAVEVWNGGLGLDDFDVHAWDAVRCDRLAGREVVPIGASDNHRVNQPPPGDLLDPALGFPRTSVFTAEATWAGLMTALAAGHVAIHEGDSFLTLDTYDADKRRAAPADARILRLRGTLDAEAEPATLRLTLATACDDPRPASIPPTVTDSVLLERQVAPGETFDLEVPFDGAPGVLAAMLRPAGLHYGALSRMLTVP